MTTKNYLLGMFPDSGHKVHACYAQLCELTHPASSSVNLFLEIVESSSRLSHTSDRTQAHKRANEYRPLLNVLVPMSFGFPVSTLRHINRLPIRSLFSPKVEKYDNMDDEEFWRKVAQAALSPKDSA
jgi:hypothetical protein